MATSEKVYEIKSVKIVVEKRSLTIYVEGVARTPGYTNPRLEPYMYIQPPPDGMYDFDFVADRPSGPVQQVLTPISCKYEWENYPGDAKGVKVHSDTNTVEEKIPS